MKKMEINNGLVIRFCPDGLFHSGLLGIGQSFVRQVSGFRMVVKQQVEKAELFFISQAGFTNQQMKFQFESCVNRNLPVNGTGNQLRGFLAGYHKRFFHVMIQHNRQRYRMNLYR